jgi:uncharacterized protein YcbX
MPTARVRTIQLHPIKALDAVCVREARVLASGALALDRRWALFDARDRPINGKNRPEIHQVRAYYDLARLLVMLDGRTWSLERQGDDIARWFSERLNERVVLRENAAAGFPDDTVSPGPTFVSQASVERVAVWFDIPATEARRRFRTNLECDGVEPFWEDRLYGGAFHLGAVRLEAVNPCRRCIVPSRDPQSGDARAGFQRLFMERREHELPDAAMRSYFDHHYRFAVNTRIPASEAGKIIAVDDEVRASGS